MSRQSLWCWPEASPSIEPCSTDKTAQPGSTRASWTPRLSSGPWENVPESAAVLKCARDRRLWKAEIEVAKTRYEEALVVFQSVAHHSAAARCLKSLARLAQRTGRGDEVEVLFRRALAEYEEALGCRGRAVAEATTETYSRSQGRGEPAAADASDVFLFEAFHGYLALEDHQGRIEVLRELGVIARDADRLPESETWLRESLKEPEAWQAGWSTDRSGLNRAWALLELARTVHLDGRGDEAAATLREALDIARRWRDEEEPGWPAEGEPRLHMLTVLGDRYEIPFLAAPILCELGDVFRAEGQVPAAKRSYREARAIYDEVLLDYLGARRCLLALAEL